MNQKLCKELRRIARSRTVGKPERNLIWVERRHADKRVTHHLVNDPASTRGVYRSLKREARLLRRAAA